MGGYMSWIDWVILVVPVCFVMFMGFYCQRYIRGVMDFLSCGRVCGRYVLCLGDVANALSIIGLVAYIEVQYKAGFALNFWSSIIAPLSIVLGLVGFCTYRFRETRSMSLGQFLELRYGSRRLRMFGAGLRSLAEMLANMIMPAVAARFFIQMLNLPPTVLGLPTFDVLVILFLTLAITLICLGGTLALVITDTIQGMILYPLLVAFIIFMMCKFSWSQEIIPVMADRVAGESFMDPYDISKLRDFNVFSMVIVAIFTTIMQRASWMGSGADTAAKSAHEAKMASLLAGWRSSMITIFYLIIACSLIAFLNHKDFAQEANKIRKQLATRVTQDLKDVDNSTKNALYKTIDGIPVQIHNIGVDAPLSQDKNLDTEFLAHMHTTLKDEARINAQSKLDAEKEKLVLDTEEKQAAFAERSRRTLIDAEGKANDAFQQCRTLYNQLTLSVTMRNLLPTGLFGAFCLLLFLAMLSTDDTRIYSATLTLSQDCVFPFFKKGLTPKQHVRMIRIVAISVGVFFALGSHFMSQLDYINLFVSLACSMWCTGCGPVLTFGLYWKKGTRQAAWASLLVGMSLSLAYVFIQRNWANIVYPALAKAELVELGDKILRMASAPWGTWIVWRMDAVKCPVNSYEFSFFASLLTMLLYIIVSLCTCKVECNMDKLLHRGKYADPNEPPKNLKMDWSPRNVFKNIIGITPEYTRGDRFIAYGVFAHSFVYGFVLLFVLTVAWNVISPWNIQYWSVYFMVKYFYVPAFFAFITFFWFGIGGTRDMFRLFHDLKARNHVDISDNGSVSDEDKAQQEK